jgi:gluconolactonase
MATESRAKTPETAVSRREILTGAALAVASLALSRATSAEPWEQAKYPDPRVRVLDPAFNALRLGLAGVERLATGFRHIEGPVWIGEGHYLIFSHIPENRLLRWDEESGQVSVFRRPSGYTNGNTRDRQGRLLSCEHDNRRVTRTEYDGRITVIADKFDGKPLNSPNDIVCRSDGTIFFTDPPFGINGYYEGHLDRPELPTNVYRIDPQGKINLAADGISPNGIAFSPDEKKLYITDSTLQPRGITAFDLAADGALSNRQPFTQSATAGADGIKVDERGNVWASWGGGADPMEQGVRIFAPDGKPIGQIALPERAHNLAFGGTNRNRLFMTAQQSLYALYVNTQGTRLA